MLTFLVIFRVFHAILDDPIQISRQISTNNVDSPSSTSTTHAYSRRDVELTSLGIVLKAYLITPNSPGRDKVPLVIVSHGAGSVKENYLELAAHLAGGGVASLLVDMHGHGQSGGEPFQVNIKEWVADIQAAIDYAQQLPEVDPNKIAAFGLSSGGTAILEAAVIDPRLGALITLDATVMNTLPFSVTATMTLLGWIGTVKKWFTGSDLKISLLGMLKELQLCADPEINERVRSEPGKMKAFAAFPVPGGLPAFFVDTIKRVPLVKAPTLVIWGEEDQLDPVSTAHALHDALTCRKSLEIVPGNGHAGHLDRNRHKVYQLALDWVLQIFN